MSNLLNNIVKSCYTVIRKCHYIQLLDDGTIIVHETPMELGTSYLLELHEKKTLCMYRLIVDSSKGMPNALIIRHNDKYCVKHSLFTSVNIHNILKGINMTGLDGNIATIVAFHDLVKMI